MTCDGGISLNGEPAMWSYASSAESGPTADTSRSVGVGAPPACAAYDISAAWFSAPRMEKPALPLLS